MSKIILAATTSAATSSQFSVSKLGMNKTIIATGLAGAEYVDIQILDGNGLWVTTASTNRLTATDPVKTIAAEGDYRLSKSATVGAVSLTLSGNS